MDRTIAFSPYWDRIWARRRPILTLVAAATIGMAVIAFLLPNWYRADVELLPPSEEETGLGLASLLRGVAVPGIRIPTQVTPVDVFKVVLESRRINEQIVSRFELKQLYKKKYTEDAIKELRRHAAFKLTEAGTILIQVEDRDRQRAADMANAYVEYLDRFNRDVRMSKGRRTRQFVEGRLKENRQELEAAEKRLADYQSKHKTAVLTPQMSSAVEEAARLYARRTALQIRLGVISSFSEGSEEEIQIRQELKQLDAQLQALPGMGLELARLVRDVKALEQVFALLTAQHEEARITEARDVVTVEVLDPGMPPERKIRPKRVLMIAASFLLSLAVGVGLAVARDEGKAALLAHAVTGD